jgi:hypothetical protein
MIEHSKITTNPDPANGTTVPNVGIAAARPKPRGKRATLAAAVVSAGLTLFGLGLATGTAQADPGDPIDAPGDVAAPAPQAGPGDTPDAPGATPKIPCGSPCEYHHEEPWTVTHPEPPNGWMHRPGNSDYPRALIPGHGRR